MHQHLVALDSQTHAIYSAPHAATCGQKVLAGRQEMVKSKLLGGNLRALAAPTGRQPAGCAVVCTEHSIPAAGSASSWLEKQAAAWMRPGEGHIDQHING